MAATTVAATTEDLKASTVDFMWNHTHSVGIHLAPGLEGGHGLVGSLRFLFS